MSIKIGTTEYGCLAEFMEKCPPSDEGWRTTPTYCRVRIGEDVYVADDTEIEDNTEIKSGVAIYERAKIGYSCVIYPEAVIAIQATLDHGVVVKQGAAVGERAKLGSHVCLGEGAYVGADSVLGENVTIGNYARVEHNCEVLRRSYLGNSANLQENSNIGPGSYIPEGGRVGPDAISIFMDAGAEQGRMYHRVVYMTRDGRLRISAGCRDFTIPEALEHWGSDLYDNRSRGDEYVTMIEYVIAVARLRGLSDTQIS